MKHTGNCPRLLGGIALLALLAGGLIALSGRAAGTPVVKTITAAEDGELVYSVIYDNGKARKTDAFLPEDARFYWAAADDFSCEIVQGRVVNRLNGTALTDETGGAVQADGAMAALLQAAAQTVDHAIGQLMIVRTQTADYAVVRLNVNWSDPVVLYRYDGAQGTLEALYRWDGADLVGLAAA
jgi:hypothetical protein